MPRSTYKPKTFVARFKAAYAWNRTCDGAGLIASATSAWRIARIPPPLPARFDGHCISTEELLALTALLDEHPDWWEYPCACATCRSYG